MKIQQLIAETAGGYEDDAEDPYLHPDAKHWLESNGITNYDAIGPNTVDVNQDINWGTIVPLAEQTGWVKINHVSGSFTWVTESKLMTSHIRQLSEYFPKTVSGNCTIRCESTGGGDTITTSTLPKGSGTGTLTLQGISTFDVILNVNNDFTSTYSSYNVDVSMSTGAGKPLTILPSPWNSGITVLSDDKSPLMLPNVINGKLIVYGDKPCFESFAKIHQRVKQINGELYVQGIAPWPLLSLYRIKGITQFSCGIWDVDDNGDIVDDDAPLSSTISRIFNKYLNNHSDVLEFQEALLDAGLKEWAK